MAAQGPRDPPLRQDRTAAREGRDPHRLPQHHLLRAPVVRHPGRRPVVLRGRRGPADARPGGGARWDSPGSCHPRPGGEPGRRPGSVRLRGRRAGRDRGDHRRRRRVLHLSRGPAAGRGRRQRRAGGFPPPDDPGRAGNDARVLARGDRHGGSHGHDDVQPGRAAEGARRGLRRAGRGTGPDGRGPPAGTAGRHGGHRPGDGGGAGGLRRRPVHRRRDGAAQLGDVRQVPGGVDPQALRAGRWSGAGAHHRRAVRRREPADLRRESRGRDPELRRRELRADRPGGRHGRLGQHGVRPAQRGGRVRHQLRRHGAGRAAAWLRHRGRPGRGAPVHSGPGAVRDHQHPWQRRSPGHRHRPGVRHPRGAGGAAGLARRP